MTTTNIVNLNTIIGWDAARTSIGFVVIAAAILYAVFAFILMRQVNLMNKSFTTPAEPLFSAFARIHFFCSLIVILLAVLAF